MYMLMLPEDTKADVYLGIPHKYIEPSLAKRQGSEAQSGAPATHSSEAL
jgi:hypothetical protein